MITNNLFKDFLEDNFANNYIKDRDFQIKTNISLISYWCNELTGADDMDCDYDFRQNIANNIIKHCCQIMQLSELYNNISDACRDRKINLTTIELNKFMNDFAEKCQNHLENKFTVKFKEDKEDKKVFVEGNEKLFNFILLTCVRKSLLDNDRKIEISVSSDANYAIINLKKTKRKTENDMLFGLDTGVFKVHFDDIVFLLIKRLNGDILCEEKCITIKLPLSQGGTLRSNKPSFFEEPLFNIFNIMLADFDDYKYY